MLEVSGKPCSNSTVPLLADAAPESFTHRLIPLTVMVDMLVDGAESCLLLLLGPCV